MSVSKLVAGKGDPDLMCSRQLASHPSQTPRRVPRKGVQKTAALEGLTAIFNGAVTLGSGP